MGGATDFQDEEQWETEWKRSVSGLADLWHRERTDRATRRVVWGLGMLAIVVVGGTSPDKGGRWVLAGCLTVMAVAATAVLLRREGEAWKERRTAAGKQGKAAASAKGGADRAWYADRGKLDMETATKVRVHAGCLAGSLATLGMWFVWPPVNWWYWRDMGTSPIRWPDPTGWSAVWSAIRQGEASVDAGQVWLGLALGLVVGVLVWSSVGPMGVAWAGICAWRRRRKGNGEKPREILVACPKCGARLRVNQEGEAPGGEE